jgi:ABC-2 type transport system ATP-binding protein
LHLASQARITGRIVQFPANNAREIEQYLAAVRESGLVAEDVEIRKADLEDVFLEVMNEKEVREPMAMDLAGAMK